MPTAWLALRYAPVFTSVCGKTSDVHGVKSLSPRPFHLSSLVRVGVRARLGWAQLDSPASALTLSAAFTRITHTTYTWYRIELSLILPDGLHLRLHSTQAPRSGRARLWRATLDRSHTRTHTHTTQSLSTNLTHNHAATNLVMWPPFLCIVQRRSPRAAILLAPCDRRLSLGPDPTAAKRQGPMSTCPLHTVAAASSPSQSYVSSGDVVFTPADATA